MFGDGSDGALHVASGTTNLPLNTKHQFTTVKVDAGAVLSTASTTGAVLYIVAREKITIDGTINVSNRVTYGDNPWAVTIDGVQYTSPGVPGFYGGFGRGNYGVGYNDVSGGEPGNGGTPGGSGGAGVSTSANTNQERSVAGKKGGLSAGGSGAAYARIRRDSGTVTATAHSGTSGAGGSGFGDDGSNASGGSHEVTGGSGNFTWWSFAGGGGGAGGRAGRAGVHVVLRAPIIEINGSIITSGTAGGPGGDGGRSREYGAWSNYYGGGGGGGGGGNAGDVILTYADSYTLTGSLAQAGGSGGLGGLGYINRASRAGSGSAGSSGSVTTDQVTDPALYPTDLSIADGIATVEGFGTPIITPDPVDLAMIVGIPSQLAFGTASITMFLAVSGSIPGDEAFGAITLTQDPPPPPPPTDWSALGKEDEKVYVYKVSDRDGNYIGIWPDVEDDLQYTHRINTAGTTTTVKLARSANTTREVRSNLLSEAGDVLTTEDESRLVSVYETSNTVGEDTDVDLGYQVDVYVHYGEFGTLLAEDGTAILTEDEGRLIVASGAPLGTLAFTGRIIDYEASYGDEAFVTVTVASTGLELSREVVRDGIQTTVNFPSTNLEDIAKSILDTDPGRMTYSADSIEATGVARAMKFQLNTKLEAIQSVFDQTNDGWYWFGGVSDRNLYLKKTNTGYDHRFLLRKHIKSLSLKRSIEDLKNVVYFVGGELTPGDEASALFKVYEDSTSQSTWGRSVERIVDRRYTIEASTASRSQKTLSMFAEPLYTTTLAITSAKYDTESIRLGQTVGFGNFGNYIDHLPPLQIVQLSYAPSHVILQVGGLLGRQVDALSGIETRLSNEQYESLPNSPS